MKIVFVEAVHNFGGSTKSTLELASRLQEFGHEVVLIDFWGSNQPFTDAVKEYGIKLKVIDSIGKPKVLKNNSRLKTLINKIAHVPVFLTYRKKIDILLKEISPDVVSVNNLKCLTILKANSFYKIDFFARTWFESRKISFFKKLIFKKFTSRFLTVSQATRQAIVSGGLAAIHDVEVLHSVIDTSKFCSRDSSVNRCFLTSPIKMFCCGGFIDTKGHHIALAIANELKLRNIKFKLTLIGLVYTTDYSKNYYQDILSQIDRLNLTSNVEIILNETDVVKYFDFHDVLIHPSATEGLPRVGLEALSLGKPVIANPVGGITDIVIHNYTGFLCDYDNISDYADCIEKYINNPNVYLKHSEQANSLIEQCYLSENQVEVIRKIYPL